MPVRLETLRAHRKRIRIACRPCRNEAALQGYARAPFIDRYGDMILNDLRRRSRCRGCRDKRVTIRVEETPPWEGDQIPMRPDL